MIYLGQLFTSDGRCIKEIIKRIQIARCTFTKMKTFFRDRNINIKTKLRVIRCYVISTLLYGAETWPLSTEMEQRIESVEIWIYRRILRISWTEKMTNIRVKEKIRELGDQELEVLREYKKRKIAYCGHIIRVGGLQNLILLGKLNGKRGRGRPRKTWMDEMKRWGKWKMVAEVVRCAENRGWWRRQCR